MTEPAGSNPQEVAARLVGEHGTTFAQEAGISLVDAPGSLWQLLALAQLLSARISATAAIVSARELFDAGWTTPAALRASTWQQRVDALGRGGYRRYDFSTATRLGENAELARQRWHDDLRELHAEAGGSAKDLLRLLQEFSGIGPTGAGIFVREVQSVWPDVAPFTDKLVLAGAQRAGLPRDADALAQLVPREHLAALCAALVRVARQR